MDAFIKDFLMITTMTSTKVKMEMKINLDDNDNGAGEHDVVLLILIEKYLLRADWIKLLVVGLKSYLSVWIVFGPLNFSDRFGPFRILFGLFWMVFGSFVNDR